MQLAVKFLSLFRRKGDGERKRLPPPLILLLVNPPGGAGVVLFLPRRSVHHRWVLRARLKHTLKTV